MGDMLLINNYDQPLLQLKGQRMRRPNRKDVLNFNLTSAEVCRKDEELFLRLVGGSLWVRDVTSCCLVWECLLSSDYTSLWSSAPLVASNGNQLQNSLRRKRTFLEVHRGLPEPKDGMS